MKVCDSCQRVNLDDAETCVECGESEFKRILVPFYDDVEPYLENE